MNFKIKNITTASVIAALYVALTFISNMAGLANGAVQIRISEALTVLPCFTTAAVFGLPIGCMISNILTGCALWDIVFGTFATFLGAIGTYVLRRRKALAPLPPIVANTVIVPIVLIYTYGAKQALWFLMLTVGVGEVISAGVLGSMLTKALEKRRFEIFKKNA